MTFNIFMGILIISFILFIASRYILKIVKNKEFNGREKQLLSKWENNEFLEGNTEVIEKHNNNFINGSHNSDDRVI